MAILENVLHYEKFSNKKTVDKVLYICAQFCLIETPVSHEDKGFRFRWGWFLFFVFFAISKIVTLLLKYFDDKTLAARL